MSEEIVTRPSARGFLRKYIASFSSLIAIVIAYILSSALSVVGGWMIFLSLLIALVVLWVLRSREAGASIGLTLILVVIYSIVKLSSMSLERIASLGPRIIHVVSSDIMSFAFFVSIIVSCIVALATEMYRRSIRYVVGSEEVVIEGGVWRKQMQTIPYHMIGRVVVEQSLFGKLLNYGTVIIVSPAAWGEELYVRAIGAGGGAGGIGAGIGYARILQEISRDPLKCLYGIPNPHEVANVIREKIKIPFKAYERSIEYFSKHM